MKHPRFATRPRARGRPLRHGALSARRFDDQPTGTRKYGGMEPGAGLYEMTTGAGK